MNKLTKNILSALILGTSCIATVACNGGGTITSTPATQQQTNILPSGTFVLPNGAKSSLANPYSLV